MKWVWITLNCLCVLVAVILAIKGMWGWAIVCLLVYLVLCALLSVYIVHFVLDMKMPGNLASFFGYEKEAAQPEYIKNAIPFNASRMEVTADHGRLHASFVPAAHGQSHDYVILCHGFGCEMADGMASYAVHYMEQGYSVLTPFAAAHGKREERWITMGWPERLDMVKWVQWIRARDRQARIVLHGVSMGGATVLNTTGENPEGVVAAVADCGYSGVWDQFLYAGENLFGLSVFPTLELADLYCKARLGFSFKEASTIRQIEKSKIPTLFIHGRQDDFVPFFMLQKNYDACRVSKEMFVTDAGHAQSFIAEETYWPRVFEFLEQAKKSEGFV